MKALTLSKPEADDIAAGRVSTLTMPWPTPHRGSLVLCVVAGPARDEPFDAEAVAVAEMVDCVPIGRGYACTWQLANVRRITPQRVKAARLLFDVPEIGDGVAGLSGGGDGRYGTTRPAGLPDVSPRGGAPSSRAPPARKAVKADGPGLF